MARMARGDRDACEELYRLYARATGHFLYRRCYDVSVAEDCLQETFLRLWRAAPNWRGEGKVSTFIFQVAKNIALDAVSRSARVKARLSEAEHLGPGTAPEPADAGPGPLRQLEAAELRAAVRRAVASLPDQQREVLALIQTEGLSCRQAAEVLDLPISTVKSRMASAAETLRRRLARHIRE